MKLIDRKPKQPRRRQLANEDARMVKAAVHRATGLRIDLERLSDDDAHELCALVRAASERSLDASQQKRWETVIEAAAADPGWFAKERAASKLEKEREAERMQPSAHALLTEPGTIQIPAVVFGALQERNMSATHFLVVMVVLGSLQNQAPLHAYMHVQDDAVVVDQAENLIAPLDLDGDISHVGQALRELADAGWLVVERRGAVTIRVGPPLADPIEGR